MCFECGRRLKKIECRGKSKFICRACYSKVNHQSKQDSQFITKTLKKEKEIREVILEITQHNRNWHYIDGKPVMGFLNAFKYFRAKIYILKKRYGFTEG